MTLTIWKITVGMDACLEWIEEKTINEKSETGAEDNIFKNDLPLRGTRNKALIGLGHGGSECVFNRLNNSMLIWHVLTIQ